MWQSKHCCYLLQACFTCLHCANFTGQNIAVYQSIPLQTMRPIRDFPRLSLLVHLGSWDKLYQVIPDFSTYIKSSCSVAMHVEIPTEQSSLTENIEMLQLFTDVLVTAAARHSTTPHHQRNNYVSLEKQTFLFPFHQNI